MNRAHYTPDTFEPTESIGFLVKRCASLMTMMGERSLSSFRPALSLTEWIVLMRLRTDAHLSASTLATDIGHDLGSLTRVVDGLVAAGLVRRARSTVDRRGVELRLTAAGRRLGDLRLPGMLERLNALLGVFSAEEARLLHVLLRRLMESVQAQLERAVEPQTKSPSTRPAAAARSRPARKTIRSTP